MRPIASIAVCLAAVVWGEFSACAEEKNGIQWQEQVAEAWKQAQTDNRPLLVYVAMDGCAYCRKMERDTFSDPHIAEWVEQNFIAAKLNGPKDPMMLKRLKVSVYPTVVIVSPENKVLDSIEGYVAADKMHARFESMAANTSKRVAAKPVVPSEK